METWREFLLQWVPTLLISKSEAAPKPKLVVNSYLALAALPIGKRPIRNVVGITWGVDEMNSSKRPIQDRVLKEMPLEKVLGGVSV